MTVNILFALPNTALYERLEKAGRLLSDEESQRRDSNIKFLEPYEDIVNRWVKVIADVFGPENLYRRYAYNADHTYPRRVGPTRPWRQATARNLKRGLGILVRILWRVGIRGDYRRVFWGMAWKELKRGKIETMFQVAMVAHHLITYARECVAGKLQASNYSARTVDHPASGRPTGDPKSEVVPA
jgi:hypothetical protein